MIVREPIADPPPYQVDPVSHEGPRRRRNRSSLIGDQRPQLIQIPASNVACLDLAVPVVKSGCEVVTVTLITGEAELLGAFGKEHIVEQRRPVHCDREAASLFESVANSFRRRISLGFLPHITGHWQRVGSPW